MTSYKKPQKAKNGDSFQIWTGKRPLLRTSPHFYRGELNDSSRKKSHGHISLTTRVGFKFKVQSGEIVLLPEIMSISRAGRAECRECQFCYCQAASLRLGSDRQWEFTSDISQIFMHQGSMQTCQFPSFI